MIDVDIIRQYAVRFFVGPSRLMPKALVVQLLRGALIIAVLFGVVALVNHQEPPAVAAPAVPTPNKTDRAPLVELPRKVKLVEELTPPPRVITPRDEGVKLVVPEPTLVTVPVEPSDDRDAPPVRQKRQFKLKVDSFNAKLRRYCARPGKTERSWLRVRGVKHYCPA